jgi:hypothetical protein
MFDTFTAHDCVVSRQVGRKAVIEVDDAEATIALRLSVVEIDAVERDVAAEQSTQPAIATRRVEHSFCACARQDRRHHRHVFFGWSHRRLWRQSAAPPFLAERLYGGARAKKIRKSESARSSAG